MRARTIAVALAVVAAGTLVACSDSESKAKLYDRAPVPAVPDATAAVPATGTLPDGQYWADMAEVVDGNIELTLMQAFFGPSCVAALGEEECPNDYGVQLEPSVTMRVMADSVCCGSEASYPVSCNTTPPMLTRSPRSSMVRRMFGSGVGASLRRV